MFTTQKRFPEKESVKMYTKKDNIRFHWDIITLCNYNCNYCYARADSSSWNKMLKMSEVDDILERLNSIPEDIELIILGGEPSLSPYYFHILDNLNNSNLQSIATITNGSAPVSWILEHLKYPHVTFYITYHPGEVSFEELASKLKFIKETGLKLVLSIMLIPKYKKEIEEAVEYCLQQDIHIKANIPFSPIDTAKVAYNTDSYKQWLNMYTDKFEKYLYFYNAEGDEYIYNDIEVFLNNYNNFKGWTCFNNNVDINITDRKVKRLCSEEIVDIKDISTVIKPMKCPLDKCNCQGLLSNEKRKN